MPVEVLLDNLFPSMQIADILRLGCTNKTFATLCSDDTFWKRRLESDFNFSGAGTARTSGWKFIYRGLFNPQVYVWGSKDNGRLGLSGFSQHTGGGIPFPTQLVFSGARLVSLVAGGWSFHALDSEGRIHVWGTLNGETPILGDGFSAPGKSARTPLRLEIPATMRSISCGRSHASSLDTSHRIWNFANWAHPFWLSSPVFKDPDFKPVQIECGWMFSCVLTHSGDVLVWWPFSGEMDTRIQAARQPGNANTYAPRKGAISCVPWELNLNPTRLPPMPALPDLTSGGSAEQKPTKLIQVAGLDKHLIGLTNQGHVLIFDSLDNEITVLRGGWQYLPEFSEVNAVRDMFMGHKMEAPLTMQITHISANFEHFFAYSTGASSIVLKGDLDDANLKPKIIPGLQNKSIISVVPGDHHYIALMSSGKVLTWGVCDKGALGLGDPATLPAGAPGGFAVDGVYDLPEVKVPTEIRFDHDRKSPKDRFCFSIAAAGWHTGALVIDLEADNDESHEEEIINERSSAVRRPDFRPGGTSGQTPSIISRFRVGYAGRGR